MASGQKFHEIYAEKMMKRNDYGYPFYEPASNLEIQPGRCGYIDEHGKWNPVADLCADPEEQTKKGLQALDEVPDRAPDDKGIEWGPKFSETVSGARVDLKGGLSAEALGIPASAACVYQFSSSSDFGAILMTEPKVWREGFYHDSPFESWVKKNCAAIVKKRPEVKDHGLWVVKWIYTTPKCSLNVWTNKSKSVTIGFKANAVGIGEFAPQGTWFEANTDGGWIHSTAKDGERKVVFMGGLYFRWRRLSRTDDSLKRANPNGPKWIFRGVGHAEGSKVDIGGEEYEMLCERVGSLDIENQDEEDVF